MNKNADLFFTKGDIKMITRTNPTPFHVIDESGIRSTARRLNSAFSWSPDFRNYFAIKAAPNPAIVDILRQAGGGADCSSMPELVIAKKVGLVGEEVMFTSNDTPASEMKKAAQIGAIINLDDITMIPFLEEHAGIPDVICFRYNPGKLRKTAEGNVIGTPEEAKYGLTRSQLFVAYKIMRDKGVKRFGLHAMIASNDLNENTFIQTANMLFYLVGELSHELRIKFEFVNLGGGLGIPYRPEQKPIDIEKVSRGIQAAYEDKIVNRGLGPLKIFMENGRYLTGPHGYLITTAIHEKHTFREYIGVDACMAHLMRPGMYGAYHHITVLGKDNEPEDHKYDIVGSLCENNDKFAKERMLPKIERGDMLAIHNTGAHGPAMGFNYNGKLRAAEFLRRHDGRFEMIRRAETMDDYFATLNFPGSTFEMTLGDLEIRTD